MSDSPTCRHCGKPRMNDDQFISLLNDVEATDDEMDEFSFCPWRDDVCKKRRALEATER